MNEDQKESGKSSTASTEGESGGDMTTTASFQPCVDGSTVAEEREFLSIIRRLALDVDMETQLNSNLLAVEFAYQYVKSDRMKRKANIVRSKAKAKERDENE